MPWALSPGGIAAGVPPKSRKRYRCRECYLAYRKRDSRIQVANGNRAAASAKSDAKRGPRTNQYNEPRKRAHDLCRKYGVRLAFFDFLGWYPNDIREALNGHS